MSSIFLEFNILNEVQLIEQQAKLGQAYHGLHHAVINHNDDKPLLLLLYDYTSMRVNTSGY